MAGPWVIAAFILLAAVSDSKSEQSGIAAQEETSEPAKNLVVNPGFEQRDDSRPLPAGWNGDPSVYGWDGTTARSGNASLKLANSDPEVYRACRQKVLLLPGRKYRFSTYVKTEGILGRGAGATICLEWEDEAGRWMGGSYPTGIRGTRDWTRVEGVTRVPNEAGSASLACFAWEGMTGRAWFDDVEVVRVFDPPMRTVLVSPAYRGRITRDGPSRIHVRGRLNPIDYDFDPRGLRVVGELRRADAEVVLERVGVHVRADQPCDIEFPTEPLGPGIYVVAVNLVTPEGDTLATTRHEVVRLSDDFEARVAIDPHGRLIVEGEPFFPIGMFWSTINEEDIQLYADSRFNCLMPHTLGGEEDMDLALKHGLKVIYSLKDFYAGSRWCPGFIKTEADEEPSVRATVRRFRDHPALLAWFLNDELPEPYLPRLEAHQRWVMEEDPDHPTWVVLCQVPEVGLYINTFDVIGTDPYPIARQPASMAAEWTAKTVRQVEGARPLWQVPQACNLGNYSGYDTEAARTPSYEEKRSMAWQCICEGANGVLFYSYFDVKRNPDVPFETQWEDLKRIAEEIDSVAHVLLSVEPVVDMRATCTPEEPRWLHWTARARDGAQYIFAVNNGDGEGRVTFTVDKDLTRVRVLGEQRTIEPEGNSFEDRLRRLDVRIYQLD